MNKMTLLEESCCSIEIFSVLAGLSNAEAVLAMKAMGLKI